MVSLVSKTYGKKLLRLISWSHWFTFFNIILAILISSSYFFSEPAPETAIGQGYLVATWLSHMAFLMLVGFVLIVFPITILLPYTRFIRGISCFVFTLLLTLLVLDSFTYHALGYHLNASSSEQILQLIQNTITKDSQGFWTTTIAVTSLILAFELIVSNYAWKHIHQLQHTVFAKYVMSLFLVAFVISHCIHIWADAHLKYDVLKQDTLFPLSYPTTAKTLLNKYGMFDESYYLENQTIPLSFNSNVAPYPVLTEEICSAGHAVAQSTILILSKKSITQQQIELFNQRNTNDVIRFKRHIDSANSSDAWFNFFYSLPTMYQRNIVMQNKTPILFQRVNQLNLPTALTVITSNTTETNYFAEQIPSWVEPLFNKVDVLNNASTLIFGDHLNQLSQGLHVYYFDNDNNDQLALFTDALLLSQKRQNTPSIIWISALGNEQDLDKLSVKPALFIWPNSRQERLRILSSQTDVVPTLMQQWLSCDVHPHHYSTGENLFKLTEDRIIANSTQNGLIVFEKDKSVLINQEGHFEGYSRELEAPITIKPDHPLMINGVRHIKQYIGQ